MSAATCSAPVTVPVWPSRLTSAAALLVPGLALWLPSGYSWGAALLLLGALALLPRWWPVESDRATRALALVIVAMGVMWLFLSDPGSGWGRFDRSSKFLLALPCLWFASAFPASPAALFWGLVIGCAGAGGIALWQVFELGLWRANGTTNAIQYGNLAMLLAVLLAVLASMAVWGRGQAHRLRHGAMVVLAVIAVLLGMLGSVLSLSRGGWLALLLAMPLGLMLLGQRRWLPVSLLAALFAASLTMVAVAKPGMLAERLDRALSEVGQFGDVHGADTSVGQRLEHWQLAWDMGRERPWLGWGMQGYVQEKAERVAAGTYRTAILGYQHVHNEVLDVFVKTGVVGVTVLLLFYAVPVAVFWPRARDALVLPGVADAGLRQRVQRLQRDQLALQVAGVCVPVMFIGFGLTQVFYAHNSGIMAYLFLIILLWSCLQGVQRQLRALQG